ncbi:MAG: Stk1 family PASTA domain-containing Ser/Thr kinase [Clostridiaceae bacterium]|nr:Stk1 family PASTA domain-containing Ser/Thr kinase [Clostridiaceae bacterium]
MVGTVLGNRYEIISEIGTGGMARVYKAKDRYLQRIIAVKVLKDELREDDEFLKRFDTEAQAAASLTHPNIVQIYDVGRDNNRYYIVMEYVDGITLKEYIRQKGFLEWREAINITVQICSALSKAHSRNIIHRDIKPHNIIMTSEGVPKITDFGIARLASSETATMKIDTVGSVHYSSPEQVRGRYTDAQSDIYSIGVTIFEMVTGQVPFDGETSVVVAMKHLQDEPPVPSSLRSGIPRSLDRIILKAMAKKKQDRYRTVTDLINDLENIRSRTGVSDEIILPDLKDDDDKFSTKKFVPLGDEDLPSRKRKTRRSKENEEKNKYLMPVLYITLIVAILGSIGIFVSTIIKEMVKDPDSLTKEIILGNYVARDINEVLQELEQDGIVPEIVYVNDDYADENIIIEQDPLPDSTFKVGGITPLVLKVSKGPKMVKIPDVKWMEHNAAKYMLEDEYGLIVEEVSEHNEEVASNMAIRTEPQKDTEVKAGSKVVLFWSLGPEKKQVVVPNVVGDTYEVAVTKIVNAKLKVGKTFPEGQEGHQRVIVDQTPKAGETVVEDTEISLYFGTAPEPGEDTPVISGGNKTIKIQLPKQLRSEETVELSGYVIDKETGEQYEIFRYESVPTKDFPYSKVIPIPSSGGVTVRVYCNDIIAFEKEY